MLCLELVLFPENGRLPWRAASAGLVSQVSGFRFRSIVQPDRDTSGSLFTDGIPEARSPAGAVFGKRRMLEVADANLDRPAAEIVAALYRAVQEFCRPDKPCDDITMIVIKVEPEAAAPDQG